MEFLRTPDERFAALTDWPHAPNYVEVPAGNQSAESLRMHYVDAGPRAGSAILLLHGEPSWSYLYRTMIARLADGDFRVLAPDLIGFGRSDKPIDRDAYTYQRHVDWIEAWLLELDLTDITLFAQDWGGLIGLRVLAIHPDRFARVIVANTMLPTGEQAATDAFLQWQSYAATSPRFPVAKILQNSTVTELEPQVLAAYEAPFPDDSYLAGARIFPALVPTDPDDPAAPANRAAWDVLKQWDKPFLTAFSDSDPITRGGEKLFQRLVPGARDRQHPTIAGAGHFLQEDKGGELAELLIRFAGES